MENRSELLEKAYQVAVKAHEGQVDKGGNPYIEHPLHVASFVDTEELKAVALLHDVLEDSAYTADDLRKEGIPETIVKAVIAITHVVIDDSDEEYLDYIRALGKNEMARRVKIADLEHNMDISRIPVPTKRDYRRIEKYQKAMQILKRVE